MLAGTSSIPSVGGVYLSNDYGVNWTRVININSQRVRTLAISSSGQYQAAAAYGSNLYISSDFGITWTTTNISTNWNSVSMDGTGQYMGAIDGITGNIYVSSNYGVNWSVVPNITLDNGRIAGSSNGLYQAALGNQSPIYISPTDTTLTYSINSLSTGLSSEISSRISGDVSLSTGLSSEISSRISGDVSLSTGLTSATSYKW
jgi:photosystem II stability/assembly factor-like uncharacterized protein